MAEERYLQAAALSFCQGESEPPALSAVGQEAMAAQIVSIARRHGIPVVEESQLCEALCDLPLDQQIPSALFEAAALVLAKLRAIGDRQRRA